MYFDGSERIARRATFSRSTIEKLDAFLAQPYVKRFEEHQVREKAGLQEDLSPILTEYERERIIRSRTVYLCPEHDIELQVDSERVGECRDCRKSYQLHDCPSKQVYERIAKPDSAPPAGVAMSDSFGTGQTAWWKHPENALRITTIVLTIVGIIIALIIGLIQIDLAAKTPQPPTSIAITPTTPSGFVTKEAPPEWTAHPTGADSPTGTQLLTTEATAEHTVESTDRP